jgi:hypothetical protein
MGERFLLCRDGRRSILPRRHLPDHHRYIASGAEQDGLDDVFEYLCAEIGFLAIPAAACKARGACVVVVPAVPDRPQMTVKRAAAAPAERHAEQKRCVLAAA